MIPDPEVSDTPRRDFNLTSASVRVRKLITRRGTRRVKRLKFTLQTWNDLEDTDGRRYTRARMAAAHALPAPPIIV